ncbi:phage major capsid protein [Diplocloster modestus]|uniref:Phage major capsid protein n=1 Tax=Diplocloster modestus TaxID=2850322 RepID=A0ABS6KCP6_9FIRM|nr:phage major capsid protein [Diplocloster modestus]MBU9728274.1 phage major capsid protein [Diplocloster modestus]
MISKDIMVQDRQELAQQFSEALASGDEKKVAQAMADMAGNIQQQVLQEAQLINVEQADATTLAQRGIRQLTSIEKKYYESVIDAMKSNDPKQALTNLDVTMPETIFEDVFTELVAEHPLLDAIDFVNTTYITEWILNKNDKQIATWGKIDAEVEKEISSGFEKISMILHSLTAFMPVAKSMLDLGAQWLDKYVREVLKDALYVGLEEGIVNGTGLEQPIGMTKDLDAARADGEAYKDKTAIVVKDFTPATYGAILSKLAKTKNGRARTITEVIMIVNPVDYFTKVMPATTIITPQGTYVNNILPFPTRVIQCEQMEEGKAVIGIVNKYFMGMGTGKDGVIEASDEYRFLQRERVYLAYIYGNGKPKDNKAFEVLDISGIEPAAYVIKKAGDTQTVEVEKTAWTQEELEGMTIDQIKGLAAYKGYDITKTVKAEIITEFLEAQEVV